MKILSGLIYHESNTFNPFPTTLDQFVIREGEQILDRFASTPVFRAAGAEIIPSVYATAFSSGPVEREAYEYIKSRLRRAIDENPDVDGIWLHLHGAMLVEGIGCAEVDLLQEIRGRVGDDVPIAVALDPHGNIDPRVPQLATVMRAYRTIPHVDQPDIERRTAAHLVGLIEGRGTGGPIAFSAVPRVISGDIPLSGDSPLTDIHRVLDEVEALPGILDASFFVGFAWADVTQCGGSAVVVPESEEHAQLAREQADRIRDYVLARYPEFAFHTPTMEVAETVEALAHIDHLPTVVSDSGDNTTGGGVGYSTVLLREILAQNPSKSVCVSTILDPKTMRSLESAQVGERVSVSVGMDIDDISRAVALDGVLKAKGDLLGYMSSVNDRIGAVCTITVGSVDVVLTDQPGSFVSVNHFHAAGLRPEDYSVVVVKQGYLFPEINELAGGHIMSITPGATYQSIDRLEYRNVDRARIYTP